MSPDHVRAALVAASQREHTCQWIATCLEALHEHNSSVPTMMRAAWELADEIYQAAAQAQLEFAAQQPENDA